MKKQRSGEIVYAPSDLIRYVASPFASWMDRYYLENPGAITPDEVTEDAKLIAQNPEQRHLGYDVNLLPDAIDDEIKHRKLSLVFPDTWLLQEA